MNCKSCLSLKFSRSLLTMANRSVGDPTAFREIYSKSSIYSFTCSPLCVWLSSGLEAGNKFPKAESYSVIQGRRPFDLTGERSEKVHSEQRKLVARAYSMDSMVYLEPKINAVVESLTKKLDQLCGQTIDLGDWLQFFAFGGTLRCPKPPFAANVPFSPQMSSDPSASPESLDTSRQETTKAYSSVSRTAWVPRRGLCTLGGSSACTSGCSL